MPVIKAHAAGIDVGSDKMFVSVPTDSTPTPVAVFGAFTPDLLELAAWLKECGVIHVAMESTGVYWIPLYELLEEQGFQVTLVAPNYPRKPDKSDIEDCQWLQYLHSVGLLRGSFRPPEAIRAIREILRHRAALIQQAAATIQRMQKSLTQMNLLLHNVLSDITGCTGIAIIDAILAGERNPRVLARFRNPRCKASVEVIEKSLTGHYRDEHLFTLRQSRQAYEFYQQQIATCDAEIAAMLKRLDDAEPPAQAPAPDDPKKNSHVKNAVRLPHRSLRDEMIRVHGVDLTEIPGIGPNIVCTILAEAGRDLSSFPNADAFASWLKLSPRPRITGGKKVGRPWPSGEPPLAIALRQGAQTLHNSKTYFGEFYRKMRARFGSPIAIKATAHKLARILYTMITTKSRYDETRFALAQQRANQRALKRLHHQAARFGYVMTPISPAAGAQQDAIPIINA